MLGKNYRDRQLSERNYSSRTEGWVRVMTSVEVTSVVTCQIFESNIIFNKSTLGNGEA